MWVRSALIILPVTDDDTLLLLRSGHLHDDSSTASGAHAKHKSTSLRRIKNHLIHQRLFFSDELQIIVSLRLRRRSLSRPFSTTFSGSSYHPSYSRKAS